MNLARRYLVFRGMGLVTAATARVWGGEFLRADANGFNRVGHLRQFRLPGGEAAVKEPRRSAVGLLYEIFGDQLWSHNHLLTAFDRSELPLIRQMLEKGVNAPVTSSAGRLFDAVAGLIGLRLRASFEGQAAMELEFAAYERADDKYSFALQEKSPFVIDWQPAILEIIDDLRAGETREMISAKFHNMLSEMIVAAARKIGQDKVVLSGGCFQNRLLTERTIDRLAAENFRPYWHQRIPPNRRRDITRASCRRLHVRKSRASRNQMNLIYAQIVEIFVEDEMRMARIKAGGAVKKVSLDLLTDVSCGDTVLLCDGVAISKVRPAGAVENNDVSGDSR
jgi:Hydrogenase maturation factor